MMGLRAPGQTIGRARKLRSTLTLPEGLLWEQIRGGQLDGLRFRRQHPLGRYILDFYCASARLAVEVDGSHHDLEAQMRHDNRRDDWLAGEGIRVLRIAAADILDDKAFEGVLQIIAIAAATGEILEGYESPRADRHKTPPSPRFAWSPSPVNGGRTTSVAVSRDLGSSPAKRGRGTAEGGGGGVPPVSDPKEQS